jgi:hypothetical protein
LVAVIGGLKAWYAYVVLLLLLRIIRKRFSLFCVAAKNTVLMGESSRKLASTRRTLGKDWTSRVRQRRTRCYQRQTEDHPNDEEVRRLSIVGSKPGSAASLDTTTKFNSIKVS